MAKLRGLDDVRVRSAEAASARARKESQIAGVKGFDASAHERAAKYHVQAFKRWAEADSRSRSDATNPVVLSRMREHSDAERDHGRAAAFANPSAAFQVIQNVEEERREDVVAATLQEHGIEPDADRGAMKSWAERRKDAEDASQQANDESRVARLASHVGNGAEEHADAATAHRIAAAAHERAGNSERADEHRQKAAEHATKSGDEYKRDELGRFSS